MKQILAFSLLFFLTGILINGQQKLASSVYDWEKVPVKKTSSGEMKEFFSNPTRSLELFEIKAITINPGKSVQKELVGQGTDELLIIKEGVADIQINNEIKVFEEGSVAVASSGDEVTLTNRQKSRMVYYSIHFRPYPADLKKLALKKISPVFVDWKSVEFKPAANGGRRNIMQQKTSDLEELEIHVTTLMEGLASHSGHTHTDEEIILVRYGTVEMTIAGAHAEVGPGSVIFVTNDDNHGLINAGKGKCEYYAFRWLTEPPVQKQVK